jgi:hypothetical protein
MNQRSEVMAEFLVLKNELNESNKFANQQTQLVFEIVTEASGRQVLFAKLSVDQKIRMHQKQTGQGWLVADENKYLNLAEYILGLLKIYDDQKQNIKLLFNDYFYSEFNKLLGFK